MTESNWSDMVLPLGAINKLTDKLLVDLGEFREHMNLPDDELGAELVLTEALIAYQDAKEALALAQDRYQSTMRNWARVRLPILKAKQMEIEASRKAAETDQPKADDGVGTHPTAQSSEK